MEQQLSLFEKDPALRMRDSKGRFATPQKAMTDKAIEENKILRLQVEKFKRAWLAVGKISSTYHRELVKAQKELNELRKLRNKLAPL